MSTTLLSLVVHAQVAWWRARARLAPESGQTSAEYALVLLGAGAVALLVLGWASQTDRVGRLLDTVFGQLLKHVKG